MILSMTGFGRASISTPDYNFTIDVKSLNSKQLDLFMRIPSMFREIEIELRNLISPLLERGKVDMVVQCDYVGPSAPASLNMNVLKAYKEQISAMSEELGIPKPEDWYATLLRLPDTLKTESHSITESDADAIRQATGNAALELRAFRLHEGEKLFAFFTEKIGNIRRLLSEVDPFESTRVEKIRQRLEAQLERLNSIEYDKGRLEQELIFYIEKLDVTEEKTRLSAHLNYFMETMGGKDEIPSAGQGKKLGFIAQEMGREINTLGSKSNDAEMQRIVVKMKDELEQIKEQVLNVL